MLHVAYTARIPPIHHPEVLIQKAKAFAPSAFWEQEPPFIAVLLWRCMRGVLCFFVNWRDWTLVGALSGVAVVAACFVNDLLRRDDELSPQKFGATRAAILDGDRLKAEALCFKGHEKISGMLSELIGKVRKGEDETKKAYDAIKNDTSLSTERRNGELAKIELKWKDVSIGYAAKIQELKKLDLKLSDLVQEKLDEVVRGVAKTAELDVVLNKRTQSLLNVFYSADNIDITDIVIKRLDEILPSVDLERLKND
ncbi:MAG: OmpH family outer membrane protein [Alphaproteobacteria bacterium]|nr:OmpH family outer membrane protein [Alphaproteobacteria bacterium]